MAEQVGKLVEHDEGWTGARGQAHNRIDGLLPIGEGQPSSGYPEVSAERPAETIQCLSPFLLDRLVVEPV